MSDAFMLAAALVACTVSLGWLALAMDVHWQQACGRVPRAAGTVRVLRVLGALGLLVSLLLCLAVDHPSMASLVWVMALAGAALTVAFTLSWRPHWLAPLALRLPRRR